MNSKKKYTTEIKVLYDLCIFNFAFIIWSITDDVLFKDISSLFFVGVFVIITLIILKHFKYLDIDYDSFKYEVRNMMFFLGASIVFLFLASSDLSQQLFKFYLSFIIFAVLLLRNTRDFISNLNNKKSMRNSIFIAVFILFISTNLISKWLINLFYVLLKFINYIFDFLVIEILYVVTSILAPVFEWIKFPKLKPSRLTNPAAVDSHGKTNITKKPETGSIYVDYFIKILLVVIIGAIIYFVVKAFLKGSKKRNSKTQVDEIIEIENIFVAPKKKVKRNIFWKNLSPREKIKMIYLKFERATYKKGIFKPYYTSTQLVSAVKDKAHFMDAPEHISEIYNKTKFSNLEVDEEDVLSMEKETREAKEAVTKYQRADTN